MSKKALIKCLREIIGLFDLTVIAVGNILWCQNELRTQDNSSILLLLLTIDKGNDRNIIKYHGDFFENFNGGHEGHDNLEATWLASSRHYG